jgi:hypothetical protein
MSKRMKKRNYRSRRKESRGQNTESKQRGKKTSASMLASME